MEPSGTPQSPSDEGAARLMGLLHRLVLDAIRSPNRRNAIFRILNDSAKLIPYERAALWSFASGRPRLLGISGQASVPPRTELLEAWHRVVSTASCPEEPVVLSGGPGDRVDTRDWSRVIGDGQDQQVLWLPLRTEAGVPAVLWLERGAAAPWREDEIALLTVLAEGYGVALEHHEDGRAYWWRRMGPGRFGRRVGAVAVGVVIAAFLFLYPLRMKVVAPCEILASDPHLVTAPLNGVVEKLAVKPGARVEKDDVLFRYEQTIPQQELKVARQQVEIAQAQLDRATVLALKGEDTESQVAVLRDRLAQEKARLELSQSVVDRLCVMAAADGVVQIADPHTWAGRPVRIGERIMTIVDPDRTKVRMWISQDDKVGGIADRPVSIVLYAKPHVATLARISFVSNAAGMSPAGRSSFMAEATWADGLGSGALGLKGQAILYGKRVSPAYWICRKPWAAMRRRLGL